jgi:dTDP-4-amino-4,6-dideoxygalactose transaminase
MIEFVNLKKQYQSIKSEIDSAIHNIIDQTAFISGQEAKTFEVSFAKYLGIKHCVACANGTDSLEILLQAMGIGKGDEVLVPAVSWISSSEAVSAVGATPIFVDIHPDFYTINSELIEEKITSNTKAIIPVHLYGQACDMDRIMEIAKRHNLKVLEDCAQSHGAQFKGKNVGTFGDCASFSFYPGKNLGAFGDAGGMVTNDDNIAIISRRIANHGQEGKHNHLMEGRNSRMDGIQAAVLNVKIKYLKEWTAKRQTVANFYNKNIINEKIVIPKVVENGSHVYHLYVIQTDNRDKLIKIFEEKGIGFGIHYPEALPFLKCYENLNFHPKDFPVAYRFVRNIISIPMCTELTDIELIEVAKALNNF